MGRVRARTTARAAEATNVGGYVDDYGLGRHELFRRLPQSLDGGKLSSSAKRHNPRSAIVPAFRVRGVHEAAYAGLVTGISDLLEHARRMSARSVNSILTATYWEIGRRIVEFEQGGKARAEYGEALLEASGRRPDGQARARVLGAESSADADVLPGLGDLPTRVGKFEARVDLAPRKGWTHRRFAQHRRANLAELPSRCRELGGNLPISASAVSSAARIIDYARLIGGVFPLSWSHYVRLMSVTTARAQAFYEAEAIRGGWSVRQLDRQISTQFYERSSHSKRQAAMLAKGQIAKPEDAMTVEDEVRDPYLLEFLNLKDEYSENELEEALIRHLEWFLLELGAGFTFVARQKRIRIGGVWYRIDLLLYHRGLRCLVVIDLKTGEFTHADAGQMNLYLNYAKRHLMLPDEADPVGIILCSEKDDAVVEYAIGDIRAKVFASKYLTNLPDKETLRQEILNTQRALAAHKAAKGKDQ